MKLLASLVATDKKIKVKSLEPHEKHKNLFVLTDTNGKKYAVGAKTINELELDEDDCLKLGTYKTYESNGCTWIGANTENTITL